MSGNNIDFDATTVASSQPFTPIPAGKYRAMIVESEIKPTKNGLGKYLQVVWEILDGEFKGRKIWDRLNIVNTNATAQEIAQRALSAICHATGALKIQSSAQLHNKPVMIKVTVKQDKGYEPANEIKAYEAIDGTSAPAAAPTTASDVPAWARKSA